MSNLEKRIAVLEQATKLLAEQPKPTTRHLTVEDFQKMKREITTRERPNLSEEEQTQKCRTQVEEMLRRQKFGKSVT